MGWGWDGKESRLLLAITTTLLFGMLGPGVGEGVIAVGGDIGRR